MWEKPDFEIQKVISPLTEECPWLSDGTPGAHTHVDSQSEGSITKQNLGLSR